MPSLEFVATERPASNLRLRRILCLHGGGSNARIFEAQCRRINAALKSHFRLVFVDAPFFSQAGPDVTSVYADWGPFRRWLRWTPDHPELSPEEAMAEIDNAIARTMEEDNRKGATGEWVGLLGFSQGAKMCASLLLRQQMRMKKLGNGPRLGKYKRGPEFRFAVIMAGRGPLVSLDEELIMTPRLHNAASMSMERLNSSGWFSNRSGWDDVVQIPTIHVHGLQDPGLDRHQEFLQDYFEEDTTRLVVWDGNHRVPLKSGDVAAVVDAIMDFARQTGVLDVTSRAKLS